MGIAEKFSRSEVKGQGHSEAKYTFPAEGYPSTSTYGRPSVVLAAEVYIDQPCDIEADKFFLSVTWSPDLGLNLGLGLKSRGHSLCLGSLHGLGLGRPILVSRNRYRTHNTVSH